MQITTDWIALWQTLVAINNHRRSRSFHKHQRALEFDRSVRNRWQKPDSSRNFFQSLLQPQFTVLDIGAGTGAWSILAAGAVKQVTAVEPDEEMRMVFQENLRRAQITNVDLVDGHWPAVDVAPHDVTLCSHSMYGIHDIVSFIHKMDLVTQQWVLLLVRQPTLDGIMAEAAQIVWGHPYDSPNFVILYNILLQMGIYPNVLMEDTGLWRPWRHTSIEDALEEVKSRLDLTDQRYDEALQNILQKRLTEENGELVWPASVRSALIYWKPGLARKAW